MYVYKFSLLTFPCLQRWLCNLVTPSYIYKKIVNELPVFKKEETGLVSLFFAFSFHTWSFVLPRILSHQITNIMLNTLMIPQSYWLNPGLTVSRSFCYLRKINLFWGLGIEFCFTCIRKQSLITPNTEPARLGPDYSRRIEKQTASGGPQPNPLQDSNPAINLCWAKCEAQRSCNI